MIRLLQIADLHFCQRELQSALSHFRNSMTNVPIIGKHLDLEISWPTPRVLTSLTELITTRDPDALLLCGDITTFGDSASYRIALDWLTPLLTRPGGRVRHCVAVPGNHDALRFHLSYFQYRLRGQLPWLANYGLSRLLAESVSHLTPFLDPNVGESDDALHSYRTFLEGHAAIQGKTLELSFDPHSRLIVFPFRSLSADTVWMNLGVARPAEWTALRQSLASSPQHGMLKMVILHHNPVSTPGKVESNIANAYNSMPGGTQFLQTLQQMGVELVLHGHQHEHAVYSFDFDLNSSGQTFALGAPSGACGDTPGANEINVYDINHATVIHYGYTERNGFAPLRPNGQTELNFERNRPTDTATRTARLELKRYSYRDPDEDERYWDWLLQEGAEYAYISGRHFKTIREARFSAIRKLLEASTKVRILISRPELLRAVANASQSGEHVQALWGAREHLGQLADSAQDTLEGFASLLRDLSPLERRRLDIRVAHTLLPFAAVARDPTRPWGRMGVRLLPVGAVRDIAPPVIGLNCRSDRAFYKYYLTYLRYLYLRGQAIMGEWDCGDTDLTEGLDPDLLAILAKPDGNQL